jgi:hypothetical protein
MGGFGWMTAACGAAIATACFAGQPQTTGGANDEPPLSRQHRRGRQLPQLKMRRSRDTAGRVVVFDPKERWGYPGGRCVETQMRSDLCWQRTLPDGRKPVKKTINLDEGEVSLIVPDKLSIDSCERLETWLTAFLMKTRRQAMISQGLAKMCTSMVAHVANDDEGPK